MKNDFKSFLAVEFSNYLQLLLSAGRSTRNHEIMLRSLDSFLLQNHTFEKCLSESIINQWLSTICGTSANKVSYIARYPWTAEEARREGEIEIWRASHKANIACRDAIEEAIRRNFDGIHLKEDCLRPVLDEFGIMMPPFYVSGSVCGSHTPLCREPFLPAV